MPTKVTLLCRMTLSCAAGGRQGDRSAPCAGRGRIVSLGALMLVASSGLEADAQDLSSAHFRQPAGQFVSIAAGPFDVVGGPAEARAAGLSLGAGFDFSPAGGSASLRSILPGFWPIRIGESPSLDLDGDGAAYFLDEDDDGDGLLDVHETGTGVYGSPVDTGTSPFVLDSDSDGFSDGVEVSAGSDPNDPGSLPGPAAVPALSAGSRLVLLFLVCVLGLAMSLPRRWRST